MIPLPGSIVTFEPRPVIIATLFKATSLPTYGFFSVLSKLYK